MTARCTEKVYDSSGYGSMRGHQCGNRAKHDPDPDGNPTKCGIHSAAAVTRRKEKSDAKYAEFAKEMNRKRDIRNINAEAVSVVESIADGHNDPRRLCQEWVARRRALG